MNAGGELKKEYLKKKKKKKNKALCTVVALSKNTSIPTWCLSSLINI